MPKAKPYTKEEILKGMKHTRSIRALARYLGCSYQHIKPFMKIHKDEKSGKTLFELHKNQQGFGIPKFLPNKRNEPILKEILAGSISISSFSTQKIKERLIVEGYIEECCHRCGFNDRRVIDYKIPLLLNFKHGNKKDFRLENLELLCYNCYYLMVGDIYSPNQILTIEDHNSSQNASEFTNVDERIKHVDWEIDEDQMKNLKNLGLWDEEEEDDFNFHSK